MEFYDRKFIYVPKGEHGWDKNTFTTPHALLLDEETIRIYGGARDDEGISRIFYIDVSAEDPSKILKIKDEPVLDIGEKGCFDDNGMILGDILNVNEKLYMYYVGFQHVQKVKFCAFSGLAVSTDGGESFKRVKQTPILDRTDKGRFGRCVHTVLYEDGIFKCYYAAINDWKYINDIPYPVYDIWYLESEDGINFPTYDDCHCIGTTGREYRIGRPKVYRSDDGYEMLYTRDTIDKEYLIGRSISKDGIIWERADETFVLRGSGVGFDSVSANYPVRLNCKYGSYIFYSGNGMGTEGVGCCKIR